MKKTKAAKKITADYWPTEGADHHDISSHAIYRDREIDNFLSGNQRTFLIASKGMGKTLLLRAKKKLAEEASDGTLVIPRNAEADIPDWKGTISPDAPTTIGEWSEIWTAAIIFSILTHKYDHVEGSENERSIHLYFETTRTDARFMDRLLAAIENKHERPPSFFVNLLLEWPKDTISRFLSSPRGLADLSNRYIRNSVTLFFDAIDNALTERFAGNLEIWRNAQTALLHAAFRLNIANRHIHVYAAIRQEAWASFVHADRAVISGKSLVLEYTINDLRPMFLLAISRYTKNTGLEDFFGGLKGIPNGRSGELEDLFEYIYRHSVGTSRSIMQIGARVHRQDLKTLYSDDASRIQIIRSVVNIVASDQAYNDYLISQKRIFLEALHEPADIDTFLSLIPTNVMRGSTLRNISKLYQAMMADNARYAHPFCELLNNGLLGFVETEISTQKQKQRFMKPHEFNWQMHSMIHDHRIYLIHPSLQGRIRFQRPVTFHVNPSNVIGDGRTWDSACKIFPKIFISHAHADKSKVKELVAKIQQGLDLVLPCDFWFDEKSLTAGENIVSGIEAGLRSSDLVLLFISRDSLKSRWVDQEWRTKYLEEITTAQIRVICCIIDGSRHENIPEFLQGKTAVHLDGDDEHVAGNIKKLVDDISRMLAAQYVMP